MPLYKKKPFALVEKPDDLQPQELVFQIRFTKEIFRSYNEYLKRINLYRKRAWTCKATGKSNLTYEEALASEKKASERIQTIPHEYIAPVLREIQFSMLNLKDLVNSIAAKFQGPFAEGAEVYGRKDGDIKLCKIVKVIEDDEDEDEIQYEIVWLGSEHKRSGKSLVSADELTGKHVPFSKRLLKAFVKDSTYRSLPWVLDDNLAKKHGISTAPPETLTDKISIRDGLVVCNKKRKRTEDTRNTVETTEKEIKVYRRKNRLTSEPSIPGNSVNEGKENLEAPLIKYPIDDLLVQPTEEDRLLMEKPSPCKDFNIPMDCVGSLLMVWDFCSSFGRLLNLSPFSLEDFENSICHKGGVPSLIVESYSSLLRLLVEDDGKFSTAIESKKRKPKITQITWTDYLCEFMDACCTIEISVHTSTIKRGHYGLLDIRVKLAIFRELVTQALEAEILREKLEEYIEERQALAAARRDEALDEGKKRREQKEQKKLKTNGDEGKEGSRVKSGKGNHTVPNGVPEKNNGKALSQQNYSSDDSIQNHSSKNSDFEQGDSTSKKNAKKQKVETNIISEDGNHPSKRQIHKLMKNEIKESIEMKSAEQRKEFLEREIEKRSIRTSPLGKDRNYCRYWFFRREGRIFVESADSAWWGFYQSKEELDALIGSLNTKGEREKALKKHLQKFYCKICLEIQKRSKEAVQKNAMEEALVRRSTRVRAPSRENTALAFLKYVNKWKKEV